MIFYLHLIIFGYFVVCITLTQAVTRRIMKGLVDLEMENNAHI